MVKKPNFIHPKNPIAFASAESLPLSNRTARVAEIVRHALVDILLRTHFRHPDLAQSHLITVSEVTLTPDLKNAHVMVYPLQNAPLQHTPSSRPPLEATVTALNQASGFLRSMLAKKMTQKSTPALQFYVDTRFDDASRIDEILWESKK